MKIEIVAIDNIKPFVKKSGTGLDIEIVINKYQVENLLAEIVDYYGEDFVVNYVKSL